MLKGQQFLGLRTGICALVPDDLTACHVPLALQ